MNKYNKLISRLQIHDSCTMNNEDGYKAILEMDIEELLIDIVLEQAEKIEALEKKINQKG